VASLREDDGPSKINRHNRARTIQISGNLAPGGALGSIQKEVKQIIKDTKLPPGMSFLFLGESENFAELVINMITAAILAIVFVYLILCSLYESFIIPI